MDEFKSRLKSYFKSNWGYATIMLIIALIVTEIVICNMEETEVSTIPSEQESNVLDNSTEEIKEIYHVDYKYLDQFIDYLHTNSDAYIDASQEFLKNQYIVWYTNKGYSDIIVGIDGQLESTSDSISIFDVTSEPYDEMPEGIYTWYGEGFSMVATIEYINKAHDGGIINLTGYSSVGEQFNSTCEKFYKTSNFDENGGYYSCGPYINFKFNKEAQQLEVIDVTINMYEALTCQPGGTPEEVQEVLDKWQISFDGNYDFVCPYIYEEN